MKLINFVISVVFIFAIYQCTQSNDNGVEPCLNPMIENTIKSYIDNNEIILTIEDFEDGNIDTVFNYFIVYFHNKGNITFFTICQTPWPPYVFFPEIERKNDSLIHISYIINERNVSIISDQSIPTNDLFRICENSNQIEKMDVDAPIYDGSLYPETYQYTKLQGKIIITKLDNPILDFKPGWKSYEDYLMKKAKDKKTN